MVTGCCMLRDTRSMANIYFKYFEKIIVEKIHFIGFKTSTFSQKLLGFCILFVNF